jgi:hypothetical protein
MCNAEKAELLQTEEEAKKAEEETAQKVATQRPCGARGAKEQKTAQGAISQRQENSPPQLPA